MEIKGSRAMISRWITTDNKQWKCQMCGKGLHIWSIESDEPQWIQCPDCKAIMLNNESIGG